MAAFESKGHIAKPFLPLLFTLSPHPSNFLQKPLVKIHTWADVKTRRELDLLASIGVAGGLQAATFVPTSQHPLSLASASLPSGRDVSGAGEYGSEALLSGGPGHPGLGSLGLGVAPSGGMMGSGGPGAGVGPGALPRSLGRAGKASKSKGSGGGRTYTSRFRGVHQTFPTRRWEAQFRRAGKPTSLGCFDREEEAARAYDKMMLWCELHNVTGVKGGITNFELSEYEGDVAWLQKITQDQLVQVLRSDGRRQAAARNLKQKRDGHSPRHGVASEHSQF